MTPLTTDARRQNNRDAFATRFPQVMAALDNAGPPRTHLVEIDGRAVDIELEGGRLYPSAEPEWSEQQFESHRADPDRITLADIRYCNPSPVSFQLADDLSSFVQDRLPEQMLPTVPLVDVGYAFLLGLGLGYQLPMLLRSTNARHVIVLEPHLEFIGHSLAAIDWNEVIELADERGIEIHFVCGDDPEVLAHLTEAVVSRHGNTFLDGSAFFIGYYAWVLEETYRKLRERLKTHYISSGFFEDEICMMQNTLANLSRWDFRLLEKRPHLAQSHPVILVGAGPSLDADFDQLHRLRDRAIIVSCGTAIGVLLKNGIRPDLHCELERGELVYDLLSAERDRHGFDGIRLIASTTIDPRIGELFAERWFFYRDSLSPARLLAGETRSLDRAEPLCCNAAFSAVTTLGFNNVFLFGLDLGQRRNARHHARDSVYFDADKTDLDELYQKRLDRIVPGNFGGEIQTWWAFDAGRRSLARLQGVVGVNLTNCSDGALIEGARPRVAASVTLPASPLSRDQVLSRVERQLSPIPPGAAVARSIWRNTLPPVIASSAFWRNCSPGFRKKVAVSTNSTGASPNGCAKMPTASSATPRSPAVHSPGCCGLAISFPADSPPRRIVRRASPSSPIATVNALRLWQIR
ncbi:MAG: DUF115 domain-containing protein [Rhodospirillales bacterium]|nr:DUF115 domain-containing protein [Rhodospirillales bacterium]